MFDTNKVGHSFPPFTITVEPANIRGLARTSGDDNPIYQNHRKAQQVGSSHIPLFPTAGMLFHFWENTPFVEHLAELGLDVAQLMYREESYEYLVPALPGETLTGVMTVLNGSTRKRAYSSSIDLVTIQLRYTNRHHQLVLIAMISLASRD